MNLAFAKWSFCSLFLCPRGNVEERWSCVNHPMCGQLALSNFSLNFALACCSYTDVCLGEDVGRKPHIEKRMRRNVLANA